jgi:exodeoxyribonuclease-5
VRNTLGYTLNPDQERAYTEVMESIKARRHHLVTGDAGSGKTVLMQVIAATLHEGWKPVAISAPTHQACGVARKKLRAGGVDVGVCTLQTLLGLTPKPRGDKLIFTRNPKAESVNADIVFIDETSMVGTDLYQHIERWLDGRAVIFFGDEGQLFPVGEGRSPTFDTEHHSHLSKPERQAEDNPVLAAAWEVRKCQTDGPNWDWCKPAHSGAYGVFVPREPGVWLKKAFTSEEFNADSLAFRYLCWTNKTVATTNIRIRQWRYGPTNTPFVVGERALIRETLVERRKIILNTNEEVIVREIGKDNRAGLPTWRMVVETEDKKAVEVHMPADERAYQAKLTAMADTARRNGEWGRFHAFKQSLVTAQAPYTLTVHNSQGLTMRNTFVDIPEMRRWVGSNRGEGLRGLYVSATRPTHGLICVEG